MTPLTLKTEYQYIRFCQMPVVGRGRKTHIFSVQNVRHCDQIGCVQWDGGWRQYVFQPFPRTIYSAGCLADIQDFIRQAMEEHKAKP